MCVCLCLRGIPIEFSLISAVYLRPNNPSELAESENRDACALRLKEKLMENRENSWLLYRASESVRLERRKTKNFQLEFHERNATHFAANIKFALHLTFIYRVDYDAGRK